MNFSVPTHLPYPLWAAEDSSGDELRSTHGSALAQLGYTLVVEECPGEAIDALSRALALRPESFTIREWRAACYIDLGDFDKALADLHEVVVRNPDHATTYNNRGLCYLLMGRYAEALEDFNACIILNPEHVIAYSNRAIVYCKLKQYWPALQSCKVGLSLDETNETLMKTQRQILEALATLGTDDKEQASP